MTSAFRILSGRAGRRRHRPLRGQVRTIGGRKIIADGLERSLWSDFYHNAMTVNWPTFFGALAAAFLLLNFAFAVVYALGAEPIANARPGSFADLFFFSVETTSTVGYGDMHPQSMYGHFVATGENFIGLVLLAVMTGLTFARFSRPRARIVFAKNPVITLHQGVPTLIVRLANARAAFITEANARLWALRPTHTLEGRRFVAFEPLRLIKSENPALALSWSLFHPIDADSPLSGVDQEELLASETNFIVSISGVDETTVQPVRVRYTFTAADVRMNHEFVDIINIDEHGVRHVDYAKIHETRPVRSERSPP